MFSQDLPQGAMALALFAATVAFLTFSPMVRSVTGDRKAAVVTAVLVAAVTAAFFVTGAADPLFAVADPFPS